MNEHSAGTSRLTPEQRDRVLDLAARLQAQHEAGIGVDDLVHAAAEAGIDARFVRQAASSIVQTPPAPPAPTVAASPDRNIACVLLGVLTLFNAAVSVSHFIQFPNLIPAIWFTLLAAVTGFWSVKGRLPVWLVSAVLMMTLLTTQTFLEITHRGGYDRYREVTMMMIVFQAVIALLVGGATRLALYLRSRGTASTTPWP